MTMQTPTRITNFEIYDVRFPTSRDLDGSDAMNPSPDYSAAYLRLFTSDPKSRFGDGFVFTIGDGNDVQLAAVEHVAKRVVGLGVDDLTTSMGEIARDLTGSSPWRWLGPEKGIAHMASGAVINALWDIRARREGLPLWDALASMTPDDLVDLVDFRYLEDAITRTEALRLLAEAQPGRERRKALLRTEGYPAYSTTPGWLGYSDEKMVNLCRAAAAQGFPLIKLKVGRDLTDDIRRLSLARDALGDSFAIAVDANQTWGVEEAISWVGELAKYNPYWVEEPTSPDDILGHARIAESISPIRVATGEHVHNRVMFKQFLQARAVDVVQLDATRVGGINENIAIILLAAKYGKPVCPHAGGVGLCEVVQHLAMFDFVAVSGSIDGRMIEYVDHLHEHFATPVRVRDGRYYPPERPGTGATMRDESLANFRYPLGQAWSRAASPTDYGT